MSTFLKAADESVFAVAVGGGWFLTSNEGEAIMSAVDEGVGNEFAACDVVATDDMGVTIVNVAVEENNRVSGTSEFFCEF